MCLHVNCIACNLFPFFLTNQFIFPNVIFTEPSLFDFYVAVSDK